MAQRVKLFSTMPDNLRVPHGGGETWTPAAMLVGMHGPPFHAHARARAHAHIYTYARAT